MTIRVLFNIILLGLCAYGSWGVLNEAVPTYNASEIEYVMFMLAPWALLYGSIKAWHRTFIWRRMLNARQNPPVLSRGGYQQQRNKLRPSILEHICAAMFILALAAILQIFSIDNIAWWIGSLIFSWLCLRMVIMAVRRP